MGFIVTDALNQNSKAGIDDTPKARSRIKDISIFKIYPNKLNFFPQNKIEEKAQEILAVGLIESLTVKYAPCDKGEYGLISGERRWRALKLLVEQGHKEFEIATCQIRTPENEYEEKIEIIMANSHRDKDIATLIQSEKELKETLEYMKANNMPLKGFDLNKGRLRDIIASILNTSKTKVALIESINNNLIPEFKEELEKERLTFSAAAEIAGMEEDKQQEVLSKYEASGEITYTEIKDIKEDLKQQEPPEEPEEEQQTPDEVTVPLEETEETKGQQEPINPEPLNMTSKCYSCANWNECDERNTTVTACNEYKSKNPPQEKAEPIKQSSHSESVPVSPERVAQVHDIKIAHMFFEDAKSGIKPFELRKKDRDYKVGDTLHQMEYKDGEYTGRELYQEITYILEDYTGLKDDYCIMGVKNI